MRNLGGAVTVSQTSEKVEVKQGAAAQRASVLTVANTNAPLAALAVTPDELAKCKSGTRHAIHTAD